MPIQRQLTEDELQELMQKGIDPSQYRGKTVTIATPDELEAQSAPATGPVNEPIGKLSTVGRTLKAHAGGIVGGGAAALSAAALLGAPETFGASLLMLPLIAAAGAGGSMLGEKGQGAIVGDETQTRLNKEAQEAAQENPLTAVGTDIVASALASGGSFKPSNIPRAGRAIASTLGRKGVEKLDREALQSVMLNAAVNPAINAPIQKLTTGEWPSGKDLLYQAAGGSLFSGQSRLGALVHGGTKVPIETPAETTAKTPSAEPVTQVESPFIAKGQDGKYGIDDVAVREAYKALHPKPDTEGMNDVDSYKAMTQWRQKLSTSAEQMRNELHEVYSKASADIAQPAATPASEVTTKAKEVLPADAKPSPFEGKKTWVDYLTEEETKAYNEAASKGDEDTFSKLRQLAETRKKNDKVQTVEGTSETLDATPLQRPFGVKDKGELDTITWPENIHPDVLQRTGMSGVSLDAKGNPLNPDRPSEGGQMFHAPIEPDSEYNKKNALFHEWYAKYNTTKMSQTLYDELFEHILNDPYLKKRYAEAKQRNPKMDMGDAATNLASNLRVELTKNKKDRIYINSPEASKDAQYVIENYPDLADIADHLENYDIPQRMRMFAEQQMRDLGYDSHEIASMLDEWNTGDSRTQIYEEYPELGHFIDNELFHNHTFNAPESPELTQYRQLAKELNELIKAGKGGTPEFVTKWKQIEAIKNKNAGNPPEGWMSNSGQNMKIAERSGPQLLDHWFKGSEIEPEVSKYLKKYTLALGTTKPKPSIDEVRAAINRKATELNLGPDEIHKLHAQLDNHIDNLNYLEKHISDGRQLDYTGVVYSNAKIELAKMKSSSRWGKLAEHLLNTMDERGLNTDVLYDPSGTRGGYSNDETGVYDRINIPLSSISNEHVKIHEIVHAATVLKIPIEFRAKDANGKRILTGEQLKSRMDEYLKNGKNDAIKEIIQSYYETAKQLGMSDDLFGGTKKGLAGVPDEAAPFFSEGSDLKGFKANYSRGYAMGDLHEFIAGVLSDDKFQKYLNAMPSGVEGKSMWTRLLESIQKLLGFKPSENSLLARAIKPVETLIGQERPTRVPEQSFGETSNAPDDNWLKRMFKPGVESIKDINHPAGEIVGSAFHKVLDTKEQLVGKWLNPVLNYARSVGITNYSPESKRLEAAARYERETGANDGDKMLTTPEEKKLFALGKQAIQDINARQIALDEPTLRKGKLTKTTPDDAKWPTMTNPRVAELYRNHKDTSKLDAKFIDYQISLGATLPDAQKALVDWKKGIQGDTKSTNNRLFFEASRKEMNTPLPPEFTRPGFLKNIESFIHRQAMDKAYYQHVESNDNVMMGLGERTGTWNRPLVPLDEGIAGNPHVRTQLEEMRGHLAGGLGYHNEKALSSLATTMFIGPGTTVHKILSNAVGMITYVDNPYQTAKMLGGMLTNASKGVQHSIENGITKPTARSMSDIIQGNLTMAERLQALAHTVKGIYSAGDLVDRWGNGLMQAGLEQAMPLKVSRANAGDRTQQDLLKRIDPDYTVGKTYNPTELSQLASKLVNSITGTGDGRTMPTWMSGDTELSGFFKLSHWGIAQTNRFMQDVIGPAKHGNITPLLTSLFGSAVGGYLIKELREKVQGKKGQIPSLQELASTDKGLKGNVPLVAYNLMASLSYAGFGGMLSQFAKVPFDKYYKNTSQGATFPLDEVATDLAKTLGEASTAIANDPNLNWLSLTQHIVQHMLTTNFQLGRTAYNQMVDHNLISGDLSEKKKLSDLMGQLRRFSMSTGRPYNEIDEAGNQFMNIEQRKFKLEQDPMKAMQMLPKLIANIMDKYSEHPDVMMSKIQALKQNQYGTFPSMEKMPLAFMHYLGYLEKLKGPQDAQAELRNFLTHKITNEAKASVVP